MELDFSTKYTIEPRYNDTLIQSGERAKKNSTHPIERFV